MRGWNEIGNCFPGTETTRMNGTHVVPSLRELWLFKDRDQMVVTTWHLLNTNYVPIPLRIVSLNIVTTLPDRW